MVKPSVPKMVLGPGAEHATESPFVSSHLFERRLRIRFSLHSGVSRYTRLTSSPCLLIKTLLYLSQARSTSQTHVNRHGWYSGRK